MPNKKYCICRKAYSSGGMVGCDKCDEWYHFKCIGVSKEYVDAQPEWFCDKCLKDSKQCARPECCTEARKNSKYCSDECGYQFNKQRYERFFLPKWERLKKQHSHIRDLKINELDRLEHETTNVTDLIKNLKEERDKLEQDIRIVKEQAKILGSEASHIKEQRKEDSDEEQEEENIISDQSRRFCVSCGADPTADKFLKHLLACHKKQESSFVCYLTQQNNPRISEDDEIINIYCNKLVDKKRGWFCPNIAITCPIHTNYNPDPDEICACPLMDVQDFIVPCTSYCLKLKKDCTLHYHWDRFRLASKDYAMADAFQKLGRLREQIQLTQFSLNDTYGGVVGVMLHDTEDHGVDRATDRDIKDYKEIDETEDQEMVDA